MLATSPSNIYCTRLFVFPIQLLVRVARKGNHSWLDLFDGLHFWKFCRWCLGSLLTDVLAKKEYSMYPSFRSKAGQINVDTSWQQNIFYSNFSPSSQITLFQTFILFSIRKIPVSLLSPILISFLSLTLT